MRRTGTGRILVWRGGSLWIGLAGAGTGVHAHHAIQATLAFPGGRVRLSDRAGNWSTHAAAIVPAHVPHAFEAGGQRVALIFADPESRHGRALHLRHRDQGIVPVPAKAIARSLADLVAAYDARAGNDVLIEKALAVIAGLAGAHDGPVSAPDARIAHAVHLLRERIRGSITQASIASAVHLSPDRFRHLFVAETGITFRAYVLWLRLEQSLAAYVSGMALTDAALEGGFADSAHFSRTFRRMFGIAPASVRPE